MHSIKYYPIKQTGVAALLVTVMLALIAAVATIYVNRSGLLLQKSVANNAQGIMANQAAEAGMNTFLAQIQNDIAILDANPADTSTTLIATAPTGTASCAPGGGSFPYVFQSPYADSTATPANTRFLPTVFFTNSINLINSITNINPNLSYKVQAVIIGNTMHIKSYGLSNGTDASAIVRKSIKIKGGFTVGGAGITIGGYTDAQGDIDVLNWTDSPICAVQYGDSYNVDLAGIGVIPRYDCAAGVNACPPQTMGITPSNLFQSMFGMSKSEMANKATSVTTGCPAWDAYATPNKIIIINGDLSSFCPISGTNNLIILNGNLTGTGTIQADGLVYVNNLYQNGALMITGSIAIENNWDVGALGAMIDRFPGTPVVNSKADSQSPKPADYNTNPAYLRDTHTARGSLNVSYKKYIPPPPPSGDRIIISTSSWIDF